MPMARTIRFRSPRSLAVRGSISTITPRSCSLIRRRGASRLSSRRRSCPTSPGRSPCSTRGPACRGAKTTGLTYFPWDDGPGGPRSDDPITGLHPDRARQITFVKKDRKLIGLRWHAATATRRIPSGCGEIRSSTSDFAAELAGAKRKLGN